MFTNINTFESPTSESCSISVSFESRYGTCLFFVTRAAITFPSAESDLLMYLASVSCCPVASDFFSRSLPARSTSCNFPNVCVFVIASLVCTQTVSTQ